MTGAVPTSVPSRRSWTTTYDSGVVDQMWAQLVWETSTPSDSTIVIEARSSNSNSTGSFGAYHVAENGVALSVPDGQYLQVRVVFVRASSDESPSLASLRIFLHS